MYATNIDYSEDEIKEICEEIMNMRYKYKQKQVKIHALYCRADSLTDLSYE